VMVALVVGSAAFAVTALICFTALRAWRGWLDLKRVELAERRTLEQDGEGDVGVRIELAAVKERVKQLEAIASGVEL
jgi:hypothetical protein